MIIMAGEYYPNLVREFYADIHFKSDHYKVNITTTVKGVRIHLDRASLVQFLGILDEEHSVYFKHASTCIFADLN